MADISVRGPFVEGSIVVLRDVTGIPADDADPGQFLDDLGNDGDVVVVGPDDLKATVDRLLAEPSS